jgi:DNA-3-methyladenine glycosylase I
MSGPVVQNTEIAPELSTRQSFATRFRNRTTACGFPIFLLSPFRNDTVGSMKMLTPNPSADGKFRCPWCLTDPIYMAYHDEEWGVPCHDDLRWFEMLVLESAQAGLSWITILRKRENYARAFANWDVERVARFGEKDRQRLLADAGIVRNRGKIDSAINNAQRFIEVRDKIGSFDSYLWQFTEGRVLAPKTPWHTLKDVPTETKESQAMSKDLRKRGFAFVGPTICYSLMQACGLVNDHLEGCYRLKELKGKK